MQIRLTVKYVSRLGEKAMRFLAAGELVDLPEADAKRLLAAKQAQTPELPWPPVKEVASSQDPVASQNEHSSPTTGDGLPPTAAVLPDAPIRVVLP